MDEEAVLAALDDENFVKRIDAIEQLRESVRRNNGQLLCGNLKRLFSILRARLTDTVWNVRHQCMLLIVAVIPEFGPDLETTLAIVLPTLVVCLGDPKVVVRKAALQALSLYVRHSGNVEAVLAALVRSGLENDNWRIRNECALAVTSLLQESPAAADVARVVEALVGRLRDVSDEVAASAVQALEYIESAVGRAAFRAAIERLPPALQQLYRNASEGAARPSSAGHGVRASQDWTPVGDRSGASVQSIRLSRAGAPPASIADVPAPKVSAASASDELEFGFVPPDILRQLRDASNWKLRADAIEELHRVVNGLMDTAPLGRHLGELLAFLTSLVEDANFKIVLTTLQIVAAVVNKVGLGIRPHLATFVPSLIQRLGDSKIVIRQANVKVFHRLMQILTPRPVLEMLLSDLGHRNWHVREEIINTVIVSLLSFQRYDFDYARISRDLAPMLDDPKSRVRMVATEAYAVMAHNVGLQRYMLVLREAGLPPPAIALLSERFASRSLPHLNADGLVEHPGLARGVTPASPAIPGDADLDSSGDFGGGAATPRRNQSAGGVSARGKLPWEAETPGRSRSGRMSTSASNGDDSGLQSLDSSMNSTSSFNHSDGASSLRGREGRPPRARAVTVGTERPAASVATAPPPKRSASIAAPSHTSPPPSNGRHPDAFAGDAYAAVAALSSHDARPPSDRAYQPSFSHASGPRSNSWDDVSAARERPSDDGRARRPVTGEGTPMPFKPKLARPKSVPRDTRDSPPDGADAKGTVDDADAGIAEKIASIKRKALERSMTSDSDRESSPSPPKATRAASRPPAESPSALRSQSEREREKPRERRDSERERERDVRKEKESSRDTERERDGDRDERAAPVHGRAAAAAQQPRGPTNFDDVVVGRSTRPFEVSEYPPGMTQPPADSERTPRRTSRHASEPPPAVGTASNATPPPLAKATASRLQQKAQSAPLSGPGRERRTSADDGNDAPPAAQPERRRGRSSSQAVSTDADDAPPPRRATLERSESMPAGVRMADELSFEELEPFPSPEKELTRALANLRGADDWELHYDALTAIRRLAAHHAEVLSTELVAVLAAVKVEIKNLRSSVAKNALVCFADLFRGLGRAMETDLDMTVQTLLKKAVESNAFLCELVDRALGAMIEHVSSGRPLLALLANAQHKSASVRNTASHFTAEALAALAATRQLGQKEVDRALPTVREFIADSAPETRYNGRRCLLLIAQAPGGDRLLARHLEGSANNKLRELVDSLRVKGLGDRPAGVTAATPRRARTLSSNGDLSVVGSGETNGFYADGASSTPSAKDRTPARKGLSSAPPAPVSKGSSREPADFAVLPEIIANLGSNDFRQRMDALGAITDVIERYPSEIAATQLTKVFDAFVPRLTDVNSKVNVFALQCFQRIVPTMRELLDGVLNAVIPALGANLSSANPVIRGLAGDALDALNEYAGHGMLVQSLAQVAHHSNMRVKPALVEKLADLIGPIHSKRPNLIVKYVLPLAFDLMNEQKGEIKVSGSRLLQELYNSMGPAIYEHAGRLSDQNLTKLKKILG